MRLVTTIHDPQGQFIGYTITAIELMLRRRFVSGDVHVFISQGTQGNNELTERIETRIRPLNDSLKHLGLGRILLSHETELRGAIGPSIRAPRTDFLYMLRFLYTHMTGEHLRENSIGHEPILYVDGDRLAHTVFHAPEELTVLAGEVLTRFRQDPELGLLYLNRSTEAHRTHPLPQRITEALVNAAFSYAIGTEVDVTSGCFALDSRTISTWTRIATGEEPLPVDLQLYARDTNLMEVTPIAARIAGLHIAGIYLGENSPAGSYETAWSQLPESMRWMDTRVMPNDADHWMNRTELARWWLATLRQGNHPHLLGPDGKFLFARGSEDTYRPLERGLVNFGLELRDPNNPIWNPRKNKWKVDPTEHLFEEILAQRSGSETLREIGIDESPIVGEAVRLARNREGTSVSPPSEGSGAVCTRSPV